MNKQLIASILALAIAVSSPTAALAATAPDPRADIINTAELTPASPGSKELNAYLDKLLPIVFGEEVEEEETPEIPEEDEESPEEYAAKRAAEAMEQLAEGATIADLLKSVNGDEPAPEEEETPDTYDKVLACYDYLIANVSYGSHMANLGASIGSTTCRSIYSAYGEVEGFGAVALSAKKGMCNAYASAFILMCRKIGLNAYLVRGQTRSGYGSYTYHEWAEVLIDGTIYLFDPQLDQSLASKGLGSYTVFCRTYDEVPGRYIKY